MPRKARLEFEGAVFHVIAVRAGLIAPKAKLDDYPWSSFPALISPPAKRPPALVAERIICGWGDSDNARGRRRYREALERRARDERRASTMDNGMLASIRRGWLFGSEEFRQKLLEKYDTFPACADSGERKSRRHDEAEAER